MPEQHFALLICAQDLVRSNLLFVLRIARIFQFYFFPRFFISHFYKVSILPSRSYDFSLLWFPRTLPHYAPNVKLLHEFCSLDLLISYLIILLPVELQVSFCFPVCHITCLPIFSFRFPVVICFVFCNLRQHTLPVG